MLDLLIDCLWNFALDWFKNQSNFISLHEFDIVLTNAFLFKQNNNSFFSIFTSKSTREIFENSVDFFALSKKQQKLKISIANRCQWCQLNYETYIIHRFQYFSCVVRTQQAYEFVVQFFEKKTCEIFECSIDFALTISSVSQKQQKQQKSNVLKIAKKTKFNAIKNVKRVKTKTLKAKKTAKSTFIVQNVDIFDSIFTCENRRFNDVAKFLQHLQHCQRLYRESNLLILLFICFDDAAFDIWYNKQNVMTTTSLNEWIKIFRIEFVMFAKSISAMICMRCDSNFNFKEKFRKHVREQHAKKSVNNSFLSNDTVKFVCEIEENSIVIETFVLQISHILFTISRNQIVFEIISSKSSSLSNETLKIVSEFMKNASNQKITNIRAICKFCEQNLNFNRKLYEHIRNHEILKLVKNFYFSINAVNLIYKTMKKSTVIDLSASFVSQKFDISAATSKQIFESTMIFEAVISSKNSHLTFSASEIASKSMKNESNQCFFVSLFSFFQMLESERQKFAIQKSDDESSFLKISSNKSICEDEKNSTEIQKQKKIQKVIDRLVKNFHLSINAIDFVREIEKTSFVSHKSKSTKKSTTCRRCNQIFSFNNKFHEHIREQHTRKFVKSLNFRILTSELTYKIIEKSTNISSASFVSQKSFIFFTISRSQIFWLSINFESIIASTRSNLSIVTYKINSKSLKSVVVNCSFTFSISSFQISISKHQKSHNEFYFIVNDLSRMFHEKSKSFDLRQHHNRRFSSQSFDSRRFSQSCFSTSKKFYLIINNLNRIFNEKFKKKKLFQNQNNVFSQTFSNQMKIIFYFKFTINQKSSINQNSKSSKSKNLN